MKIFKKYFKRPKIVMNHYEEITYLQNSLRLLASLFAKFIKVVCISFDCHDNTLHIIVPI